MVGVASPFVERTYLSVMHRALAMLGMALMLAACDPRDAGSTSADSVPQGEGYDFYVLALSWSPTHCETAGASANRQQCGARQAHRFVVHGLWPQFENDWPEFCNSREPRRVPEALLRENLDIMPSGSLIGHQWRKHGTCAGLSQRDYFNVVRAAYEKVAIPKPYQELDDRLSVSPDKVEQEFLAANPDLPADGIAVMCKERYVSEARICLTKDLKFRSCPQVDARACRMARATMPAPN